MQLKDSIILYEYNLKNNLGEIFHITQISKFYLILI
jgi:hypothetical protein